MDQILLLSLLRSRVMSFFKQIYGKVVKITRFSHQGSYTNVKSETRGLKSSFGFPPQWPRLPVSSLHLRSGPLRKQEQSNKGPSVSIELSLPATLISWLYSQEILVRWGRNWLPPSLLGRQQPRGPQGTCRGTRSLTSITQDLENCRKEDAKWLFSACFHGKKEEKGLNRIDIRHQEELPIARMIVKAGKN